MYNVFIRAFFHWKQLVNGAGKANQNSKVVNHETKTLSWKVLKRFVELRELQSRMVIIQGGVTMSDPFHIMHSHLIHCKYTNMV